MKFKTLVNGIDTFTSTYGHASGVLLRNIALQYELETGESVTDWNFRIYEEGLVLACPTHVSGIQDQELATIDYANTFIKAAARTYEALENVEADEDEMFSLTMIKTAMDDAAEIRSYR